MALINTILIGAQKAGTTTLYDWIAQHPDVYGPEGMKDFPFFCDETYYQKGIKWFENNFSHIKEQRIILHGNVNYLYFSEISAKRINQYNPDVKLIALLRNPVDRAYSAFWQQRKAGYEDLDNFVNAIEQERKRSEGAFRDRANLTYIDHGFYAQQLKNYYKIFPKDNIKVMIFEEIIRSNNETASGLYNFLEIDPNFKPNYVIKNESGLPRFRIVSNLLRKKIKFDLIKDLLPINYRIIIKNKLRDFNTRKIKYEPLNHEIKVKLLELYRDDIHELEQLLDRKIISLWIS